MLPLSISALRTALPLEADGAVDDVFVGVALAVAAPTITQKLSKLTIPHAITDWFELSDLVIAYYDDYLGIGATPVFIAPDRWN